MLFMNDGEIADAHTRYRDHPVLGPATATLSALRDAADANSDGWAYWPAPRRAAKKLQELIQGPEADAAPAKLRAAYAPIKAFRTRSGLRFEIYTPALPAKTRRSPRG